MTRLYFFIKSLFKDTCPQCGHRLVCAGFYNDPGMRDLCVCHNCDFIEFID